MLKNKKIGFIGSGNMASALLKGMIKSGLVEGTNVYASDVSAEKLDSLKEEFGIHTVMKNNCEIVSTCEVIVLAVKPQIFEKVLKEISSVITPDHIVISVAAGISCEYIERMLGDGIRVVRSMPNTPALVMKGATAIAAGTYASENDMKIAHEVFATVGIVVTVDETQMDAVTGLSGSGPAYIFMVIEALSDAGVKMGLSRDVAMKLAAQTVMGAARLQIDTGMHPGRLKDMVTSPGGTAIAGLHTLEQGGLRTTLMNAVEAATLRAEELGRKNKL